MSKVLRTVAIVAAVVAVAATGLGAIMGAAAFAATFGASAATIAAVASTISAVAGALAQATMKPPDMKGSVNQIVIGKNMPVPYMIGRTYAGGLEVYDDSSGSENKFRFKIMALTAAGPIEEFVTFSADYKPMGFADGDPIGWYEDFLDVDTKLGNRPETAFTDANTMPGWTSAHKMSGFAAYKLRMKFDKDGKRFAAGMPQWGWVVKAVKIYDPRLDDTYPGGAGDQRWDDESTWEWSENPALHALAYARGRYIEKSAAGVPLAPPVKIVGCGFDRAAILVPQYVELANICDANGWKAGGTIYEGPGASKWDNLKRILQAAAAEPVWTGGQLGLKVSAPKVALVTIGLPDLADGEIAVQAMKSWRDKVNTIVPRVRLEAQKWEYTQIDAVTDEVYLAEDGEEKTREVQFDLVQDKDQGAELAAYELVNSREFGPITIPVKPHLMMFRPGEAVALDLAELGLDEQLCVITGRQVDPHTGAVMWTLESETTAKHDFALGRTSTAPPTPTIHDPQERDEAVAAPGVTDITRLIANSATRGLALTISTAGVVTVSTHERIYSDKVVSVTGATVTPSPAGTAGDKVGVFYDDEGRAGGAVTYQYDLIEDGEGEIDHMFPSPENPFRHFVTLLTVPDTGTGTGGSGTGGSSGGTGGGVGGGFVNEKVSSI